MITLSLSIAVIVSMIGTTAMLCVSKPVPVSAFEEETNPYIGQQAYEMLFQRMESEFGNYLSEYREDWPGDSESTQMLFKSMVEGDEVWDLMPLYINDSLYPELKEGAKDPIIIPTVILVVVIKCVVMGALSASLAAGWYLLNCYLDDYCTVTLDDLANNTLTSFLTGVFGVMAGTPIPDDWLTEIAPGTDGTIKDAVEYFKPYFTDVFEQIAQRVMENPLSSFSITFFSNLIEAEFQETLKNLVYTEIISPLEEYLEGTQEFPPIYADFIEETIDEVNISITTSNMEYNNKYGDSWRMLVPGSSYLEGTFDLPYVPSGVLLELIHLTSGSVNCPGGGYSPVDIYINSQLLEDNYDVAQNHCESHSWAEDTWQIEDYLNTGTNTIRIELEDDPWACTHYWVRSLSIADGLLLPEPPILSDASAIPVAGSENHFSFQITYSDINNDLPAYVSLYIDGDFIKDLTDNCIDGNFKEGVTYSYTPSYSFAIGSHNYWFETSDGNTGWDTTDTAFFEVLPPAPPCAGISVSVSPNPVDIFATATITAEVTNEDSGDPLPDKIVSFSSTLSGAFSNADLPVSGHPLQAMTDGNGIATIDWTPNESGSATIAAVVDGERAETLLNVNNPDIDIDLSLWFDSATETSTRYWIMAEVTQHGIPVPYEEICFTASAGTIDEPCVWLPASGEAQTDIIVYASGTIQICAEVIGFRECFDVAVSVGPPPSIDPFETLEVRSRAGLAWSGDGGILAGLGEYTQTVQLFNFMTMQSSESGNLPSSFKRDSMRANEAGDRLAVAQSDWLSVVELLGDSTSNCDTSTTSMRSLDWLGGDIVVGHRDGDIRRFSTSCGLSWTRSTGDGEHVMAIRSGGSTKFAAGDDAGNLYLYSSSGSQLDREPSIGGSNQEIHDIAWSPGNTHIAITGDGFAYVYTVSGNSLIGRTGLTGHSSGSDVYAVEYISDRSGSTKIATGGLDGTVQIFPTSGGASEAVSSAGGTYTLAWNPVHRIVAAGTGTQVKLINFSDDLFPPTLTVSPSSTTVPLSTDRITLDISVEDASFLRPLSVEVNGVPSTVPIPQKQSRDNVQIEVDLNIGVNTITIEVQDLYANKSTVTATIERQDDLEGPMVSDITVSPDIGAPGETFTVSARVTDEMAVGDVAAHIQDASEADIIVLNLGDDGTNGDVTAGDDIFSGQWDSSGTAEGAYLLDIRAEDTHAPPNQTLLNNCALFEIKAPTMVVNPGGIDFGEVEVVQTAEASFTLTNSGGGTLTGEASVSTPFNIQSGGSYSLTTGQTQLVTVRFSPSAAQHYSEMVTFTGGSGATRPVTGTGINPPTPGPWDVNGDGCVNLQDLVSVAQCWGQTGPEGWIPEDCYCDGVIGLSDLVTVAQHWWEGCED